MSEIGDVVRLIPVPEQLEYEGTLRPGVTMRRHAEGPYVRVEDYEKLCVALEVARRPSPAVLALVEACRELRNRRSGMGASQPRVEQVVMRDMMSALAAVEKEIGQ